MIPGVDPRQLKQMMKQMGMSQTELDAKEVIIKTSDKVYIFENPQVTAIKMKGDETFQLAGSFRVEDIKVEVEISKEDIVMVSEQASVSEDDAKIALEKVDGDIAQAIVDLTENNEN